MFENFFRRVGDRVARNSGKVIIAWIVILVVVAPFSIVFFSNVDFDIANNIVSSNSMSNRASELLSDQFDSNSSGNSSGSQVVIFVNNTDLNQIKDYQIMLNMTESLNSTASTMSSYDGISSIFSTSRLGLSSYASGTKVELNGTYALIASMNGGIFTLIPNLNNTLSLEFGIPLNFLNLYLGAYYNTSNPATLMNTTASNQYAYSAMQYSFSSNASDILQLEYLNSFTGEGWNASVSGATNQSLSMSYMSISIQHVFSAPTSKLFNFLYMSNQTDLYGLMLELYGNYSLPLYAQSASDNFAPSNAFVTSYSIDTVANQSSAQGAPLFSALNVSAEKLAWESYNLTYAPKPDTLLSDGYPQQGSVLYLTVQLVSNSTRQLFSSNPYYRVNGGTIVPFLALLNGSASANATLNEFIGNHTLSDYPIYPSAYISGNFVNSKGTAMLVVLNFKQNVSNSALSSLVNETNTFVDNVSGASALAISSTTQASQYSSQFTTGLITALAIGISLSIVLIGIFFRSPVAAFLPLLMFLFSAVLAMGVNGILYQYVFHTQVSFITPTLLLILVLGLTTDYMVYIMARYRRELRNGNPQAAQTAAKWSGHAVFTSGLTVTISYLVLWLSNIPIFSDSGLTNAIGVGITILLANTLLIALLSRYGRKIFWPTRKSLQGRIPMEHGMGKIGVFSVHNRKKLMVIFAVISLAAIYVYYNTATGLDVFGLLPKGNSAIDLVNDVNYTFGADVLDQNFVVLQMPYPIYANNSGNITFNSTDMAMLHSIEKTILSQPGVASISGPTYPFGYYQSYNLSNVSSDTRSLYITQMTSFVGKDRHYAQVTITMKNLGWAPASSHVTTALDNNLTALENSYSNSFKYYMGGTTQGLNDVFSYAYSTFLLALPILAIAIFAVLFIQLYSFFTPLRLILMVLLAVTIALAITYIVIFDILGESLIIFLPIFVVITLLAVGLDYDIFMITRVKEEIEKGSSTEQALITTVRENGGVIIMLGMLLFVTFISLAFTGIPIMLEIGFGLAVGVLIDTFISWPFFVPVVMLYLKRYNWWPSAMVVNENSPEIERTERSLAKDRKINARAKRMDRKLREKSEKKQKK